MNLFMLRYRVHTSWLITIACFFIFLGVFAAQYTVKMPLPVNLIFICSTILLLVGLLRGYVFLIPILIIGAFALGIWSGSISQTELKNYDQFYKQKIEISGSVKDDVDINISNQITIRLNNIVIKNKKYPGSLWITASSDQEIKRGDMVLLGGVLMPGFGNFSGVMYRAKIIKITKLQPGDLARQVRDWFADAIKRVIPSPESSLGIGFLVGQRRSLPPDLASSLQLAGLTHIVVASGYNLTILVRLARRLFARVSKYLSAMSAGLMIISFILVTGFSPSMIRAGIVSSLSLLAWYYGRKFHPITLLSIAITLTVLINPSYAWGDLGWQLSFAAFGGVIIFAPLLQRYLFGDKKLNFMQQILIETFSAQIVTFPIIILAFGQISNVAILSNILVLPFIPIAMLLTFIAGISSLLVPAVAIFVAKPATWLLSYMIFIADHLANLPWAVSKINFSIVWLSFCYFVIIAFCLYMRHVTKYNLRDVNIVE